MTKFKNYPTLGFVEIDGRKVQIGIGTITDKGEYIEVETLAGCSRTALLNVMEEIRSDSGKEVRAEFSGTEIRIPTLH